MDKFVFIFGPQAVGKMTVGQELARETGLKLFHNHMTIDLLEPLFGFSEEMWRLTHQFRIEIFQAFLQSNQAGMIFTKVWYFDKQEDWDDIESICQMMSSKGVTFYFVELEANVEERLHRNKTTHRLDCKPTKRNVEQSEYHLLTTLENNRLNSLPGEIDRENYIRIDNTFLSPYDVVQIIRAKFNF